MARFKEKYEKVEGACHGSCVWGELFLSRPLPCGIMG